MAKPLRICIFDNYDSFTWNLVSLFRSVRKKAAFSIIRNSDRQVFGLGFDVLVISPGPMGADRTGTLRELFDTRIVPEQVPVFGVCLGMQFLASYFHGTVGESAFPVHGRTVRILHHGNDIFRNIRNGFMAMRYNSLEVKDVRTDELQILAREESSGMIMALKHRVFPFAGVQFHPDSFLTCYAEKLVSNFLGQYAEN